MKTPKGYINSLPEPRKSELMTLHKLITKHAPKLRPLFLESAHGDTIGYGKYSYKTKSGCSGEWYTIGLANRKQYISLYVLAVVNGKYLAETYKKKLPKAKIGRSCINIKKLEDVDLKVIEKLIKDAAKIGPPA